MFVRVAFLVAIAVLAWSMVARPSTAHGDRVVYRVRAYDTLWTIASAHYGGGDVRDAVWRIQRANELSDSTLRPGQRLILP
jgi:nucleoid-associated protein YgaU